MDLIVLGVAKSQTRLSDFHFHFRLVSFRLLFSIMEKWKIRMIMRWMKLEPIIQSEVSQKEKHQYSILTHIYGI